MTLSSSRGSKVQTASLINYSDRTAPAEFFHASNEVAVWKHIIARRLHHHHEIAFPFHVKQHLGLAFSLREKEMQVVHGSFRGLFQWNANAQRAGKRDFG